MHLEILTLAYEPDRSAFDTSPLQRISSDYEILTSRDHLFFDGDAPRLLLVLRCARRPDQAREPSTVNPAAPTKPRSLGSPEYERLRAWRNERARKDGLPPYAILYNEQIDEVLRLRPQNRSQLSQIKGFGKARLAKYGDEILTQLHAQSDLPLNEAKDLAPESAQ